jgi:two-component system chemotaxis response regulator CheB
MREADRPVRVLVVNDSRTIRASLRAALHGQKGVEVCAEAASGADAVALVASKRPDVVLLDVVMAGMDGFATTRAIMGRAPTPIVLMSSVVNPRDVSVAMDTLRSGALAIVEGLPAADTPEYESRRAALVHLLRSMSRVALGPRVRDRDGAPLASVDDGESTVRVVGIAASIGGPQALAEILTRIPRVAFPPMVIVQHIADGFVAGFCEWLGRETGHAVALAEDGGALAPGRVYVAPQARQCGVDGDLKLRLSDAPPIGVFRPSATHLFRSLAPLGSKAVGVILTGMGEDGAAGACELRARGGTVVAQDEATSLVYGMPRAVVDRGCATHVLGLAEIARFLTRVAAKGAAA